MRQRVDPAVQHRTGLQIRDTLTRRPNTIDLEQCASGVRVFCTTVDHVLPGQKEKYQDLPHGAATSHSNYDVAVHVLLLEHYAAGNIRSELDERYVHTYEFISAAAHCTSQA